MSGASRRTGKQAAINELARLGGIDRPTSPGGTVPTPWLLELTQAIFGPRPADGPVGKAEAVARLARLLKLDPKAMPLAAGATVPGETLWTLVDAIAADLGTRPSQIALLESLTMSPPLLHASEEHQEALAEIGLQLWELSEHDGPLPMEFENAAIEEVDPEHIEWASNGWMATVASLQGWLRLDDDWTPAMVEVFEAAHQLFDLLGTAAPEECFEAHEGSILLTTLGVDVLSARLQTALSAKEEFVNNLEAGQSLTLATRNWLDEWDKKLTVEAAEPLEVHATAKTWRLTEFAMRCAEGNLDLNPSYQRDAVWPDPNSQALVDSILRGIPLPSIILNQREGSSVWEIVDGKQRLTAILRFIGRHPTGVAFARSLDPEGGEEAIRGPNYKAWAKTHGIKPADARAHFLPFPLAKKNKKGRDSNDPLLPLAGKYYGQIVDEKVRISGDVITIKSLFEGSGGEYAVPLILYKKTSINQIQRVFGLYNSQGKQLNQEELRNAVFHHLEAARLMLVLSGDHKSADVAELLKPSTVGDCDTGGLRELFETLNVGLSRFHCSKLVGWSMALLAHNPPAKADDTPGTPSTATYINGLLKQIDKSKNHELNQPEGLQNLMKDLTRGAELLLFLHDDRKAFSAAFTSKNPSGSSKWDDLPTISALGVCIFAAVAGVTPDTVNEETLQQLRGRTSEPAMAPPDKQQTKTQWAYLARTVPSLLEVLGVESHPLVDQLERRYGATGLQTLLTLSTGA